MEDLTGLLNKVENKGETPQGKLSADEFNKLVRAVRENQMSVRTVSYNGGVKIRPDENGNVDLLITESNYLLNLKTTVQGNAPYKVALGNTFMMNVEVSNKYLDGDQQISVTTACTATFYCNDLIVSTQDVYDGDVIEFDFGKYFTEGKNNIRVRVDNNFGEIKDTLTYEVTAIYLSIELPNFNPTEIKSGESWILDVKVVGSNANVFILIDGNGGLAGGQTAGSTIGYTITNGLTTGAHKLEVYAVSSEDSGVRTDSIKSEYIYIYEGSTQTVIATSLDDHAVFQRYNVMTVEYWIYKPEYSGDLSVTVSVIDELDQAIASSTQTVPITNNLSGVRKYDVSLFDEAFIGDRRVRIETDGETRDIPIQINLSDVKLVDVGGYDLLLSSSGRSNSDDNVRDWSYGEYKVTFPEDLEFAETASGWNYDDDNNVTLHLRRGREISLNYYPFRENPAFGNGEDVPGTKKGMTFSIELATRNCVKRDASVVRCTYNGVGFEFYANSMVFASNSEALAVDYKEDTRVRIDLVIEGQPITYTYDDNGVTKTSDEARMIVYVDGVYQQMLLISQVSNFAQEVAQPITIGSEFCDVDVYCIRAYSTALDMKGITDNYSYDTPKVEDKIAIAKRCDVFDSQLNVSYPKLITARPDLPIMLLGMGTLPNSKTRIPVPTTVYNNPLNPDDYDKGNPSWSSANDEMSNQGTSSMNYPMPYRNFDWRTASKAFLVGGQSYKKIPLYEGMPPIGKLTFYANNYKSIRWELESNLYATIDGQTGVLNVSRIGTEVDGTGPNADVTVTITTNDGSTISATSNLNFWFRDAKLGDIVYHDGTYSTFSDYDSNVQSGKTPIGICFYISPDDKSQRLMVSLANVGSDKWGPASNALSGITLADNSSVSVYNIAKILNNSPSWTYDGLRNETNGDKDGWAIYDGYSNQLGQIGWRTFTSNEFGYKVGDSIPWGQYNQLCMLEVRDLVLTDSNFNLPIPEAIGSMTEFQVVGVYKQDVNNNLGTHYDSLYYPAFSLAYAYRPTQREDLLERFTEHHWWIPSFGELIRIAYLYQEYYNPENSEGNVNPLNIFKDVIDGGIFTKFSGNYLSSNEPGSNATTSFVYLTMYYSQYHTNRSGQASKNNAAPFRAICSF